MANINDAFQPEGGINLDDLVGIFTGTLDPSIGGEAAPIGSLYVRSTGQLWQKTGAGDTEWSLFGGYGTVTSVDTVAPVAGITISGSPITTNGTLTFSLANDLAALEGLVGVGIGVRTGNDAWSLRVISGSSNISVTNGNGVSGNPTLDLSNTSVTPGSYTYTALTIDSKGRITAASSGAAPTGTVTSIAATAPVAGITISGSPVTSSGTFVFSLADDLAAVESLNSIGFSTRTATDTWATRTFQGTNDRITVSDGDGVAANPIIDIASTYAGQASITTLGTISTGTWQGTTISTQFGGTGRTTIGTSSQLLGVNTTATGLEYKTLIANAGIGLSFAGGSITISNTGVTTLTGTASQVIVTPASTGNITLSLPQSIGTGSAPTFAQVTVAANPTLALQLATKQYVDNLAQGLTVKYPVRAASAVNLTLSGEQTVDDVSLITGDRVLVKSQTNSADNGIYIVDTGAWTRALDLDSWAEAVSAFTFVEEGTINADTGWLSVANQGGTIGTTSMQWVQFSSAGVINAGTGLTKTGNTLSITNTGVVAGSGYNFFTVNAQGQLTSALTQPYLTGNQTITLQGDTTGSGTTLITTTLSNTGVAAGTYTQVTVDTKGRVTAATSPTTLTGYGITDAQPLNAFLTSEAALTTNGFVVRSGNTAYTRDILAGSTKVAITNGNGVAGDAIIDIAPSQIDINTLGGSPLTVANGGTNLTALGVSNQILGVNATGNALEYKTLSSTGITITQTPNDIHFATVNNGTVTSVAVTGSTGISVGGSPITSSGTITLTLNTELQGLITPTGLGLVTRTAVGTYVERTVISSASTIAITNPAGIAGNISLDLANTGTAGTYTRVTTDSFGRVTSGTNPTTLAGYGITDAQPLNTYLTSLAGTVSNGIVVKNGNVNLIRSVVAGSSKITVTNGDGVAGNPTVDVGTLNLNSDLADVIIAAPIDGEALLYNGTNWYNGSVSLKLYAEKPVAQVTPVASGDNSIALGSQATANAHDSIAIGRQSLARLPGIVQANGRFATQGDAQHGTYVLRTGTINGTPGIELFLDGTNGSERLTLTTDSTWVWKATIVAHRTDADDHAGFELSGVTYCGASLNSIAMLGGITKTILARSDTNLNVSASVDTASGSLLLTVTGNTGKIFRWTAVVQTVEITN